MANYRQIHVSIWKDEWFLELEPKEKLLFVYLFGNDNTSLSGIYKIALKVICFETGLDMEFVKISLEKFSQPTITAPLGKVHYADGVIWVVNMRKYHETSSPRVQQRIQSDIDKIPDCKIKQMYLYDVNKVSTPCVDTTLKEEEEEEEEIKEEEEKETNFAEGEVKNSPNVFGVYEHEIGPLTPAIAEALQILEQEHPPPWIIAAMKISAINNKRSLAYTRAILKRWKADGYGSEFKNQAKGNRSEPAGYAAIREYLQEQGLVNVNI